jgi:hypothetical protein
MHDYDQNPTMLSARYATPQAVADTLVRRRPDGRLADLQRQAPQGRAVMLSEFGGIDLHASANNPQAGATVSPPAPPTISCAATATYGQQ